MSRFSATILSLLAVAGLTGLTVWESVPRIEADLESRAATLFSESGLPAAVRIDGRDVTLRGGLGLEDRERARAELWRLWGVRDVEDVYVARAPRSAVRSALEAAGATPGPVRSGLEGRRAGEAEAASRASGQDQLQASGSEDAGVQAAEAALRDVLSTGAIVFESGAAELTPASREILDAVADVLVDHPTVSAEVQGHTDSEGGARANRRLSQRRADAVAAYLVSAGVPDPALRARGYGESEPVAPNETLDGRTRNRRVAFALGTR